MAARRNDAARSRIWPRAPDAEHITATGTAQARAQMECRNAPTEVGRCRTQGSCPLPTTGRRAARRGNGEHSCPSMERGAFESAGELIRIAAATSQLAEQHDGVSEKGMSSMRERCLGGKNRHEKREMRWRRSVTMTNEQAHGNRTIRYNST